MDNEITTEHFATIAALLPKWKYVLKMLGLEDEQIKDSEDKHPRDGELQRSDALTKWHKKEGAQATYERIHEVLCKLSERGAAEKVKALASSNGANPTNAGSSQIPQTIGSSQVDSHNQASAGVNRAPRTLQPTSNVASNGLQHSTNDQDSTDSAGEQPETPMFPVQPVHTTKISETIQYSEDRAQHVKSVTVIIQACNSNELYASLEEMDTDITNIVLPNGIQLYLGKFGTYQCALVETKQAGRCEKDIKAVLKICDKAKLVIGIGIAAGIGKNQKYGDVLVSTRILHYDQGRVQDDELIPRGDTLSVTIEADRVFASTDPKGWEFQCTKENRKSKLHTGLMVSGPYLVDSERCVKSMKKYCPEAIGYQMEAHVLQNIKGEQEFSRLHVIVIKGISDFAGVGGKKDDIWQYTAAKAAANYAKKSLLRNPCAFIEAPANAGSSQITQTMGSSQVDSHNQASAGVNREAENGPQPHQVDQPDGPAPRTLQPSSHAASNGLQHSTNDQDFTDSAPRTLQPPSRVASNSLQRSTNNQDFTDSASRVLQSATLSHATTGQDSTDSGICVCASMDICVFTLPAIIKKFSKANAGSSQIPQTMGGSQVDSHNQASAGVNRAGETAETPKYQKPRDTDKKILEAVPYSPKLKDKVDSVFIIIQACNENEFRATLSEMDGDILPVALGRDRDGITIYLGEFGKYQCALVETKQGNDCENYIKNVLGVCKNTVLVLGIGVAAGLNNEKLNYADVLVPTEVQHYDRARIENDGPKPRGQKLDVTDCAFNVFTSTHPEKWDFECTEGRKSEWKKGLLLSGPYLVDSKIYAEGLKKKNSDAIGYEMEANVLQKITKDKQYRNLEVMIIKGICDFAGLKGQKDKKWQYTAAKAAANYAKSRLLKNTDVFKPAEDAHQDREVPEQANSTFGGRGTQPPSGSSPEQ